MLQDLDYFLFHLINHSLNNEILSPLMIFVSSRWFGVLVLLGIIVYARKRPYFWWVLLGVVIVTVLADKANYIFLKPYFARLRPCKDPNIDAIIVYSCSGRFGFPSNHSLNGFLVAFLFTKYIPKCGYIFITIAALVGFSRIYLGVHYPLDILGGAALAFCLSYGIVSLLQRYLIPKLHQEKTAAD
jgi:undecaprenyl-diphosphatase